MMRRHRELLVRTEQLQWDHETYSAWGFSRKTLGTDGGWCVGYYCSSRRRKVDDVFGGGTARVSGTRPERN